MEFNVSQVRPLLS